MFVNYTSILFSVVVLIKFNMDSINNHLQWIPNYTDVFYGINNFTRTNK